MNEHKIPIPSMIYNATVGGHVTNSQQIIDENYNLEQKDINKETLGLPYNNSNPNGMGKIVLKKNDNFKQIVEAQTNGNTIFVIKYDFTLTGDVTVPANCVLKFDGGSISGAYTITGNNTGIKAGFIQIFNTNVLFAGTWNVEESYPEWFGDDYASIKSTIALASCGNKKMVLNKEYLISNNPGGYLFTLPSVFSICGTGKIKIDDGFGDFGCLFRIPVSENISIKDITIDENCHNNVRTVFVFDDTNRRNIFSFSTGKNVHIENVTVLNISSIWVVEGGGVDNLIVNNCKLLECGRDQTSKYDTSIIYSLGKNVIISNNIIERTGNGSNSAIEVEGCNVNVHDNTISNFNTGVLRASGGTTSDNISIYNNIINNAQYGIDLWATHKDINNTKICDNIISVTDSLFGTTYTQVSGINFYIPSKYSFINTIIKGNIVNYKTATATSHNESYCGISVAVYGNGDYTHGNTAEERADGTHQEISGLFIENNKINNSYGLAILIIPYVYIKNVRICNNSIINPCMATTSGTYAMMYGPNIGEMKNILISENEISIDDSNSFVERCIQFSFPSITYLPELTIRNNKFRVLNSSIHLYALHSSASGLFVSGETNILYVSGTPAKGSKMIVSNVENIFDGINWVPNN